MKLKPVLFVLLLALVVPVKLWAAAPADQVAKLYVATFNRAPDAGGLNHWANASGLTIEGIAKEFFKAPETQRKYPEGTTDAEFVNTIYQNVFGRNAEQAGLDYWVNVLSNGDSTRDKMIMTVIGGARNKDLQVLLNKTEVGLYYVNQVGGNHVDGYKFSLAGITDDLATVINEKQAIDLIAGTPAGLEDDIDYFMAILSSAGEMSPMMDEISVLLVAIINGDTSVVTITPPLENIDPFYPPSAINITADFGSGYTPAGSNSVYTGTAVINITGISFAGTNLNATANVTAGNVRRDGELVLDGAMTVGITVGMAGGNTSNISVNANVNLINLASMNALLNGNILLNMPAIRTDDGRLTLPATITLNQFSMLDYQINGTVTLTQPTSDIFDAGFNLTTNQGPVTGLLRAQTNPANPDQKILSTPHGPLTVGTASLTIQQVVMDSAACKNLPGAGNIVVTRGVETKTITFGNCAYTVN